MSGCEGEVRVALVLVRGCRARVVSRPALRAPLLERRKRARRLVAAQEGAPRQALIAGAGGDASLPQAGGRPRGREGACGAC